MWVVRRLPQETLEALVHRCYTVLSPDGHEDLGRLQRALHAVREANPSAENALNEIRLPPVVGVPYLRQIAGDLGSAERALRRGAAPRPPR